MAGYFDKTPFAMPHAEKFISSSDEEKIIAAIQKAEKNTSGEIRVHIEDHWDGDIIKRAHQIFAQLKMHKTAQRNGVLIYVAARNHQFYIMGDQGIHKKVPVNFWDENIALMKGYFVENKFTQGLIAGILKAGSQLKEHFPYQKEDINELPDEISRS